MASVVIAFVWVSLIGWFLIRAFRQYRDYTVLVPTGKTAERDAPSIAVVIPARNEGRNIEQCMRSVRTQNYPAYRMRIIVIDDNSTDDTAERAQHATEHDIRVTVQHGRPLALNWIGKSFACWQGAQLAQADWLCFIDADTIVGPECLTTAVQYACTHGVDVLSLEPLQEMVSAPERLVMLAGFMVIAVFNDLNRTRRDDAPDASGQFMLFRRSVYDAIGGHAAVSQEVCEDHVLARLVKAAGYHFRFLGGNAVIRARMYTGWRSLMDGFSKNATNMFGGAGRTAMVATGGVLFGWSVVIVPVGLWLKLTEHGDHPGMALATALAALGSLVLFSVHIAEARYFKAPWWYGLVFPIGYTMAAVVAFNAALRQARGRIKWKGRTYAFRS